MACYLINVKPLSEPILTNVNWKLHWNLTQNTTISGVLLAKFGSKIFWSKAYRIHINIYRYCPKVWKCSGKLIQNVLCRITTILSQPQCVIQNYRLIRLCFYCHELCRNITSVTCNTIILLEFAFNSLSAGPLYKLHPNLVITVPADALAPNGARTSAGTAMNTNFDIFSKCIWLLNI